MPRTPGWGVLGKAPGMGVMRAGGNFSPSQVPGLALWLVADDIAGADGDAVGTWTSRDAGAYAFAQADPTKRPLLKTAANGINGHNTVLFDGSNDLLINATGFLTGASGTIFVVSRMTAALQDFEAVLSSFDEATAATYGIGFYPYRRATQPRMSVWQKNNDTSDDIRGNSAISAGVVYCDVWTSSGTAYTMRKNGAAQTLTVTGGANNGDWFGDTPNRDNVVIGGARWNAEGHPFKGAIAEILVYTPNLSDADVSRVEAYLATRYGPFA